MKFTFAFLFGLLIIGCSEQEEYRLEDHVAFDLLESFQKFEEEAIKRGITISWEELALSAELRDIDEKAVGQCLTYDNGSRQINIDQTYWSTSTLMEREFLIFHELGHCILQRTHYDQTKQDGTCVSMMNSGESICRKNYSLETRKSYIDELFS